MLQPISLVVFHRRMALAKIGLPLNAALTAALLVAASPCLAESTSAYPTRAIRLAVPYPAGGAGDAIARAISRRMAQKLKQTIVVENKAGASQSVAAASVASAEPDGYSLLMVSGTSLVLNAMLMKQLSYNPDSLELISKWGSAPYFLVASNSINVRSVKELIDLAKSKPGTLNYGSIGKGSTLHLAGAMFANATNIDVVHVPYKGTAPALTDLLTGTIQFMFDPGTSALELARDRKIELLAVTSNERVPQFPNTPTLLESGVAGCDVNGWWGLAAPPGTPQSIRDKLATAVAEAIADPQLAKDFSNDAITFESSSPEAFKAFVNDERKKWRALLDALGITPD